MVEDNFSFDLGGLLTEEEAAMLTEEKPQEQAPKEEQVDNTENKPAEEVEQPSESVGMEKNNDEPEGKAISQKGGGSSPTKFYSSIASALKNDGIFPDEFTDDEIEAVNSPEDFAEMFEKAIEKRMSESQQRIDKALRNGVEPDVVKNYEQTISYLSGISEDELNAEGEEGDGLRARLIYNDLINRGFSHEKALKEVDKSMKSGSDLEDAKDALAALTKFYSDSYRKIQKEAEDNAKAMREKQKKDSEAFKKMILDDELKIGDNNLDKRTRQQVYDAVSKPVYKDPNTGELLTQVQKFQRENPMEFLKQIGLWYVMTNGGKNVDGLVKEQVRAEKNKGIRELERKINSTSLGSDGSLRLMSGSQIEDDTLLTDGWEIAMGNNGE